MLSSVENLPRLESNARSSRFPATALTPEARQTLAVEALAGIRPISQLATQWEVSRKFVYQQTSKAQNALNDAFHPPAPDHELLFQYAVTPARICQIVLALSLHTRGSLYGIQDWLHDILDYDISIGTIHNILATSVSGARQVNRREDLAQICIGVHDEIFQGDPVLVGIDPLSTSCYLLAQEPSRDATTWGVHLLALVERGFKPDYTVADFGTGLRAGQAEAMTGTPCWGDIFHAEMDVGKMVFYLENRAWGAMGLREQLERKMDRAKKHSQGKALSKQLAMARTEEVQAIDLADALRLLATWLQEDVLALVGPELAVRRELFDFIVSAMRAREDLAPHRIRPLRIALEKRREALLAFAERIDQELLQLARKHQLSMKEVRAVYELKSISNDDPRHWQRDTSLLRSLGTDTYRSLQHDIDLRLEKIVRASALVENVNRRLRSYFFLRRHLGPDYLELLRFFLNHRRYPRSRKVNRVGKSPAEILAGKELPHWLEQLGFTRFQRAA